MHFLEGKVIFWRIVSFHEFWRSVSLKQTALCSQNNHSIYIKASITISEFQRQVVHKYLRSARYVFSSNPKSERQWVWILFTLFGWFAWAMSRYELRERWNRKSRLTNIIDSCLIVCSSKLSFDSRFQRYDLYYNVFLWSGYVSFDYCIFFSWSSKNSERILDP
jgi:hypothetical protein